MEFKKEILEQASKDGSVKVAEAFSKLSGSKVQVSVSKVERVFLKDCLKLIKSANDQGVVVYSQVLSATPVKGVALLTMLRENALILIDLLNQQPIGTTGVLKDIDRSAIKEVLNILSNSYITALNENAAIEINLEVPNMITSMRLSDIVNNLVGEKTSNDLDVISFETTIVITSHQAEISLYLIFNNKLVELIKNN